MAGTAKVRDTVYNRHIAKRNIRMSNLTPDDVDLRLTASKAELSEEDQRLWLGLEDEKISRIAGDEANKQFTELVKQQNSGTESRLSTEVIHRSEGDVSNLNSLNAVAQALSDYRIKTDLEINNEVIARKALGVELNTRIDSFVSTWDHQKYLIYQAIQDVQDDVDGKYSSMDSRIKKYEDMLQDITTDSIQITMDNGEINMGAWTILSQAREWDLQIIAKMKDYQLAATGDINQALEDMQNKLPVEQNIIDKAIQGLSNSQVIKDLDEKLTSNIADIGAINQDLLKEATARQNEMIAQAQNTANAIKSQADELTAAILAETAARIDAVTREADIRTLQIEGINSSISEETEERIEEIRLLNDGLTAEVNSRVEGDQNITTALDNYKESNDAALANVRNTVEVLVSDTTVMSQTVSSLDARLTVTEASTATANSLAASANEKANTALTATTSLAERMESVEASIETVQGDLTNKVDVIAFNSLKTEVTAIDGRVTTNTANIASITGNITDISSQLIANTTAISELSTEQTQQGNDIEQVSSQITQLSADIDSVQDAVANKADASAVASLTTQVNQQGENITLINSDVTTLKGSVSTVEGNLASKADSTALNSLSSKVTAVDDKVSSHSGQITALNASIDNISVGGANLLKNSEGVFTPNMSSTDNYVHYHNSTVDMVNGKEYTLSGETNGEWSSEHNADAESNKAVLWLVGNGLSIVISDSSVGTKGRTFVWGNPSGTYVLRLNSYKADNSIWFKNIKIESGNKRTDWTPATSDTASAAALSTLDTKVTGIDGKVTTNSNSITTLSGKITAVENGLTTKADGSALSALTTRVSNAEGELSSQSSKVTKLEASVGNTVSHIIATFRNGNYRSGGIDAGVYTPKLVMAGGFSRGMNLIVWAADGTLGSIQGFDTWATTAAVADLAAAVLALPTNTYFTLVGVDNVGDSSAFQSNADLKNFVVANGGSSDYYSTWGVTSLPIFTSMVGTGSATGIQHSFNSNVNNDWIKYLITFIGGIPEGMSGTQRIDESKFATASALSTLDSKVTSIDGRVTANTSSVTDLQSTVNNNQANLINSYYTKTSTDIAISNQITSLSATLDMNVLPSKRDFTKANQWLLTHVIPKAAGWVSQDVYPDFSVLKTGIKNKRIYCAEGSTNLSGTEYDNTVLYFRTIVFVHEDRVVNLGSFIGDDAHSIYVNGVLNFTKGSYGPTDNLQLALKQGLNTVDVICYNGGGLAGFYSSVLLSSLVVNMYAPESVEEQAAATANAVSSLTATVSDIDGRVTSNTGSITNLQAGLTAANNSISTKADSSALNVLTARVDSTESGIQATNTSVTSLESKLDNVSVGATNLLPNTKNVGNMGTYLGFGYKRTTRPGGSTQYVDPLGYFINNLSAGTYVLSFYARANKVQYVNNFFYAPDNTQSAESSTGDKSNNSNGRVTLNLTTEWKRYWVRWVIPSDTESKGLVAARLDDYDSSEQWVEIAAPKLEKGTLATDWSPAPSDLSFDASSFASASALSTLDTKVNSIDGKVTTHASSITQLQADVSGNSSKLIVQGDVVNGLKASYVVKTDVNGLVTGYGLYNEGGVGAFGVNADYFYVGNGTTATGGKKPFMVLTSAQTIGGVTYPAGTWIDVALIANATIGSAHIANASITDAHIVSLNASKITAGIIDAERIGANSISVEKLMVGDATNLWGNQHFTQFNPYPKSPNNRERWVTDMPELKGNGIQMWGRDHYAPYSTKIPLKAGDTFVIEYIAGRNGGPDVPLYVGLWTYNINGNGGSNPWQSGPAEQIANLGDGWFRWRRTFVVTNDGHTLPVAYGVLFFNIMQEAEEPNPAYWSVGDVSIRKGVGGELIVHGSVTADKMQVGSLSAISATIGVLRTSTEGARTEISDNLIEVFDSNGKTRIKIGVWG